MTHDNQFLSPSEAARQLGVSRKALRLYEEHGMLVPLRSAARWRAYGPPEMERAGLIVKLRVLGIGIAAIESVLRGDNGALDAALQSHQRSLEIEARRLARTIADVRNERDDRARSTTTAPAVAFDLPWPWAGERFELTTFRPLTYIVGPLGSGKTRLARLLTETIPGASFLGPERAKDLRAALPVQSDRTLAAPLKRMLQRMVDRGATQSPALTGLAERIVRGDFSALIVDMVEDGLDVATQRALSACLRHDRTDRLGRPDHRPLFLMTRSNAILDLDAIGNNEAVIFCPANHTRPALVEPIPGSPGFEALLSCLASPEARARLAAGPSRQSHETDAVPA